MPHDHRAERSEAIDLMHRSLDTAEECGRFDRRVAAVVATIDSDPGCRSGLASLADGVGLSASRLRHLFAAETGMPFGSYVRRARLSMAASLLSESFLTVKEVMFRVGYGNASHFSRDFKRHFGSPPRQWRASSTIAAAKK
jgi:AraC family transcriptional regulator, arabinose operon regulatory protein